ncbi:MBL fold metallo-hydrolase [Enterobacter sp. I4]|uniref:MBL fold metallo-hydrolase n=1 Tax=Enterobacter sp. I4 TaxID=2926672 RepID=UPI001F563671|nr:MBL fold metallo-hydrolase [Enterobacter sp. I4]MCI2292035.1 MBL fold metallo-hydrolase [Enterobacter sp. I4]
MKKITTALALSGLIFVGSAWADAPAQIRQQFPGYYRLAVGHYEVTALFDGYNDLSPSLLKGLSANNIRTLLAQRRIDAERMPTSFNAFLINTGKHLIMIDSGAGNCVPQTAGQLIPNMEASGYRPGQVDAIFLTHLHLDHVCGLSDAAGKALFSNATVYVPQGEADYWLDPAKEASAPANAKEYFAIAQKALSSYSASGRLKTFVPPASPIPEVQTAYAPGHTPGSTVYRFTSEGQAIDVIGDLIHAPAIQFPHPDISIRFDVDAKKAVASRTQEFNALAKSGEWVAAAHLPFPGVGHITASDQGFSWSPAIYGPYQRAAHVPLLK